MPDNVLWLDWVLDISFEQVPTNLLKYKCSNRQLKVRLTRLFPRHSHFRPHCEKKRRHIDVTLRNSYFTVTVYLYSTVERQVCVEQVQELYITFIYISNIHIPNTTFKNKHKNYKYKYLPSYETGKSFFSGFFSQPCAFMPQVGVGRLALRRQKYNWLK